MNQYLKLWVEKVAQTFARHSVVIRHEGKLFGWQLNRFEETERLNALIYIDSRSSYQELHHQYPIQERSDLKSILRHEEPDAFHWYKLRGEAQNTVISFKTTQAMPEQVVKFYLPETMLLAELLPEGHVARVTTFGRMYFAVKCAGIVVSREQSSICSDVTHFCWMAGVSEDLPVIDISLDEVHKNLPQILWRIAPQWLPFIQWSFDSLKTIKWRQLAAYVGGIAGAYLLLVTIGFHAAIYWYKTETPEMSKDLKEASAYQRGLEGRVLMGNKLTEFVNQQQSSVSIWLILKDLDTNESTKIRSLTVRQDAITLTGHAERATDVLEILRKRPDLVDVRFDSPVTRQQSKESFVIKARLKTPTIDAGVSSAPVDSPVNNNEKNSDSLNDKAPAEKTEGAV